jgi:hypothetical protein
VPDTLARSTSTLRSGVDVSGVPFGKGCADTSIPFQVQATLPAWNTNGALWTGDDAETGEPGIIEVHRGTDLPEPQDPSPMIVLGRPATIGTISDGIVLRFTTGSTGSPCEQWALVAHPHTTMVTLRLLGSSLTEFAVGEQTMDCASGARFAATLNPGDRTILDVIDLPVNRALQTGRDGSTLFAKNGLFVHPGLAFDLVVAADFRGLVGMGWGRAAQPASVVHVPVCEGAADATHVLAYAGGFFALRPICATIEVVQSDQTVDVQLGIGLPCQGQPPVEGPTDT